MKFLLTVCLLLVSTSSSASAQQRGKDASLTRAQTREAERLLSDMGYWTGPVDGLFDPATRSALIPFQKWECRPIICPITLAELAALRTRTLPKACNPGYTILAWGLDRQFLLLMN